MHMKEKVMLVAMPWHQADIVSVQLGCLKAFLKENGIDVDSRHYYKDIVGYVDIPTYRLILYSNTGELLFAALLFPEKRDTIKEYIEKTIRGPFDFESCAASLETYMSDILNDVAWEDYHIVGFTTTHEQFLASAYLAKLIKEKNPEIKTVFGGMILVGELALNIVEFLPFVDCVVLGEGEIPLLKLSHAHKEGNYSEVPSLVYKNNGEIQVNTKKEVIQDLDRLPPPDYTDYFDYNLKSTMENLYPRLSVEASRGCWWAKCVFCVENTEWRKLYRRKTAGKVVSEIKELTRTWRSLNLIFTDPDVSDKIDIFEAIRDLEMDLNISAEVTGFATKESLKILKDAGVKNVQIGIESFNDRLLKIYNKGVGLMKMVELLKSCNELGIHLSYNIIVGAPFETKEDLDVISKNIEYINYFYPPHVSQFVVSYQSLIYHNLEKYGITEIFPPEEVKTFYPGNLGEYLTPVLSFHAGYDFEPKSKLDYTRISSQIEEWRRIFSLNPSAICKRGEDFLIIEIRTDESESNIIVEEKAEKLVYLLCMEKSLTLDDIAREFPDIPKEKIEKIVNKFVISKLMFTDGKKYLSLASLEP